MSEQKIVLNYTYHGCGFPVTIKDAPMKKFRDTWALAIDPSLIDEKVAFVLAAQDTRLTGKQVEFLRKWLTMPMRELATHLGVSHVAIHKWEKAGNKPTGMDINTEKVLRIYVFMHLGFSADKTLAIIAALTAKARAKARAVQVDASELKAG